MPRPLLPLLLLLSIPGAAHAQKASPQQTGKQAATAKDTAQKEDAAKKKAAPKKKRRPSPAMTPVKDIPGLPRVLLIGDSISIGYTVAVRNLLKNEMNVHRPLTNCGPTSRGVAELEQWLGKKPWDVIHFNFGLHDLKYMGPNGENLVSPDKGKPQVAIQKYERNLRFIVKRLKKTNAKLIWRNTTPIPRGCRGRVVGDEVKYNAIAQKVMEEFEIPIHDMYAEVQPHIDTMMRKQNVHFTPDGSKQLARNVVRQIRHLVEERVN